MSNRILYISQELTPYLPANEMSTLGQMLPQSTQENGYEVRIFMPKYGCINERRNQLHEVIRLSGMNVIIDDTDHPLIIKVASLQPSRMQVYFIDSDDYFIHKSVSDVETRLHPEDNDERIMFFTHGVLETVKKLRWEPAAVHCQGWMSALSPLMLKTLYSDDPMYQNAKVVFTLFNDPFEGSLDPKFVDKLLMGGLTSDQIKPLLDHPVTHADLYRLAMDYADAIVIGSADVDPAFIEYARATGKPVLDYNPDAERHSNYIEFYNKLLS